MQAVYSNAACTIAATAAESSDKGLFFDRDPWLVRPRVLTPTWSANAQFNDEPPLKYPLAGKYWCDHDTIWMQCVEYAPLNKRGWVFQERHLSRRIMHFTKSQLFWECHECKASENYPVSMPSWAGLTHVGLDPTPLKTKVNQLRRRTECNTVSLTDSLRSEVIPDSKIITHEKLQDLYIDWVYWREEYSRSLVTKDEDKLAAIQGIAQDVGQILGDQLLWGMWKKRLLEDLCFWTRPDSGGTVPTPFRKLTAPSWSWASTNQKISASDFTCVRHPVTYLAELSGFDSSTALIGEPLSVMLHINCNLICATATWDLLSGSEAIKVQYGVQAVSCLTGFTFLHTDTHMETDEDDIGLDNWFIDKDHRSTTVYMVVVRRCSVGYDMAEVLLLVRRPVPEQTFERIGFFAIEGDQWHQLLAEHDASERQTIILV
jgi:hypothetical protein